MNKWKLALPVAAIVQCKPTDTQSRRSRPAEAVLAGAEETLP